MTKKERKRRAIRKAIATRRANAAMLRRWREVDKPANQRVDTLFNYLLELVPMSVRWNPIQDVGRKLKHGVQVGALLRVSGGGRLWHVKPDGYKQAQVFHAGFWEPLLP